MDTLERAQEREWGTERATQEGTQVQYNNQDSHLILISHAASPASISDQVAEANSTHLSTFRQHGKHHTAFLSTKNVTKGVG